MQLESYYLNKMVFQLQKKWFFLFLNLIKKYHIN